MLPRKLTSLFSVLILILAIKGASACEESTEQVENLSPEEQEESTGQVENLPPEESTEQVENLSPEEQQLVLLAQGEEEFASPPYPSVIKAAENVQVPVRTFPSSSAPVLATVGDQTGIDIACQTTSDTVEGYYGTSDIWALVRFPNWQGYVPNSFVFAPQNRFVTSNCLLGRTTITVKPATAISFVYNDAGTGADNDISVWRADLSRDPGFYSLGDVGMSAHWPPPATIYVISAREDELRPPTDYTQVWDDTGSGGDMDVAFWQPVAPSGYTCLGHVAQVGYNKPSTDLIRCVKSSLVRAGSPQWLWNDKGSGADRDISVWEIVPNSDDPRGAALNLFISRGQYDDPGSNHGVLDRDAINGGLFGRYNVDTQTAFLFAPQIFLHPDEYYFPDSPLTFLQYVHPENGFLVTNEALGCDSCTDPAFLDGVRPDQNEVPVYANIIRRVVNDLPSNIVDIVYWTFYPYNNGKRVCIGWYSPFGCVGAYSTVGNHVGDWEHITIRFVDGYATKAYFSTHDNGEALNWGDKHRTMTQSNRLVAFAAKGSHGLYSDAARHTYRELPNGDTLDDDTGFGAQWDTWKTLVPFYWQPPGTYSGSLDFLNIAERWGNPESGCDVIYQISGQCVLNPGPEALMVRDVSKPVEGLTLQ